MVILLLVAPPEILEYCLPSKCIKQEKYYLDLLKPEYNISKNPSALFKGCKHSEEARSQISNSLAPHL
jgi:hypothetical protein